MSTHINRNPARLVVYLCWIALQAITVAASAADESARTTLGPQPGDVYRQYATHNGGNRAWRVTDPFATAAGAKAFLPNPILTIDVGDLDGAIRAEAVIDRWGGHIRTTNKRIRFNGHAWLTLEELTTTPGDTRAEDYYSQDNPVIEVPLDHLQRGANTFEGTCGALDGYGWGQWGLYSLMLRVYYDPATKDHPAGRIVSPEAGDTLGENPHILVEAAAVPGVSRIDVLAWFDGYDENGDGVFEDWHGSYHQPRRGAAAQLLDHVATLWRRPYDATWNTRWVPDQAPKSIRLVARIQDARGMWSVTDSVDRLSLARRDVSVRLYRPDEIPQRFGVRAGRTQSCTVTIPQGEPLDEAIDAVLPLRTWHGWDGHHSPLDLNGHSFSISGKNHHFDFDLLPIPTDVLRPGSNEFRIHSDTEHHMLEVLWPGPAVIVRYAK